MICREKGSEIRCRVWIVRYEGLRPDDWHDVPSGAVAVAPAERGTMAIRPARRYVEAFNRAASGGHRKVWAVAMPVRVCYEGDPQPGGVLRALPLAHEKSPLSACQVSAGNGLPPREST